MIKLITMNELKKLFKKLVIKNRFICMINRILFIIMVKHYNNELREEIPAYA